MATVVRLMGEVEDAVAQIYIRTRESERMQKVECQAAVCIQSWYRAVCVRSYLKRLNLSALTIQRRWRGCIGRDRCRELCKEKIYEMQFQYYTSLVIKLQKTWRGYRSRKYVFNFYSRREYFDQLKRKNSATRKALEKLVEQQYADWQSLAAAEKQRQTDEYLRRHHFLISTAVTPGIYNSPYRSRADEREDQLRKVKLDVPRTDDARVNVEQDDMSAWSCWMNTALPPVSAKPMGPFRDPSDVRKQRCKPLQPTLRVMSDYMSVDKARARLRQDDTVNSLPHTRFLPSKLIPPKPYTSELNSSTVYGQIPYGTQYFREEFRDVWLTTNFRTVVPPIPVFEKLNDTYC